MTNHAMPVPMWSKKLRLINEYPNDVSVWSVPPHTRKKPYYRYENFHEERFNESLSVLYIYLHCCQDTEIV